MAKREPLIIIAGGGTGGHVFPALSVALELRRQNPRVRLQWVGTARSREIELCAANNIPLRIVRVSGVNRRLTLAAIRALIQFCAVTIRLVFEFRRQRPSAVAAFGGYVCAPVLTAAIVNAIPYFIQEQNTVLGLTNRLFARAAQRLFLGFPVCEALPASVATEVTGTPVRPIDTAADFRAYPPGFDRARTTVLLCGGSQGALTMNRYCIEPVKRWLQEGVQIVWQTGKASVSEVSAELKNFSLAFVFETIPDLYPYYAVARLVVCRAGASTLAEAASFGLPCVCIPLPWSANDHQWKNAGWVEEKGWGFRIRQTDGASDEIDLGVRKILGDSALAEKMRRKALECAPVDAAQRIAERILETVAC